MARHIFPPDLFFYEGANQTITLGVAAAFRVWTARTGGTDVTASMLAIDGVTALTTNGSGDILADGDGQRPWMTGPNTLGGVEVNVLYVDTGGGDRFPIYAADSLANAMSGITGTNGFIEDLLNPGFYVPADSAGSARGWVNVKDYGATGDGITNDTAAIQAAIDACSTAGGGTVLLPAGNYSIATIKMKSYVCLRGASRSACILRLRNSTNANVIELFNNRQEQIQLRDFTIEGNRTNQTSGHGVYIANESLTSGVYPSGLLNPHHFIDNLNILNCKGTGLYFDGDSLGGECHVSNVFSYACDQYGFYTITPDSNWDRCVSGQSGSQGFFLMSPNTRFNNCKAWFSGRINSSAGDGFYLDTGMRQELTGCESQDNKRHGFVLINTRYATLTGCVADSNNWSVAGAGFRIDGSTRCYVSGLSYDKQTTPTQLYHVVFANSSEANVVDLACGPWATGGGIINGSAGDNDVRLHQVSAAGGSFNQVHGSLVMGAAALGTGATRGFIYAPSMAGTPVGTPNSFTGTVPIVVDTTASKLWAYIGGTWKGVALT